MGPPPVAMTATERSRALRGRRAHGKDVLTVLVSEDELAETARAGYAEAVSTDRKTREAAVSLFLSDAVWRLMHDEITPRARLGSLPDAGDSALPCWGRHGRVFRRQPSPLPGANTRGASAPFFGRAGSRADCVERQPPLTKRAMQTYRADEAQQSGGCRYAR